MYCCDTALTRPLLSPTNNNIQSNKTTARPRRGRHRRRRNDFPLRTSGSYEHFDSDDDEEFDSEPAECCAGVRMALRQLGLLVWKNALFRRRHYLVTALEVILPTLLAMLMAYMRTQAPHDAQIELASENNTEFPLIHQTVMLSHAGTQLSDHYGRSILAFVPNNDLTLQIMRKVKDAVPGTYELEGFNTEDEIEIYLAQIGLNKSIHAASVKAAVIFDAGLEKEQSAFPPRHRVSYKIRMVDVYGLETTDELFPWFQLPGPDTQGVVNYVNSGFSGLQIAVDRALISVLTGTEPQQEIGTQAFPYPPYSGVLDFKQFYFIMLPQFLVLGFIFIVPSIIRNVVSEKETGIKELMKMMGLPGWMHWVGWMLNSLLVLVFTITLVVLLFFVQFDAKSGAVIAFSSPTLWWFVLFLYIMAATAFCFFISTFFQRPTLATTAGIVLWLLSYYAPVLTLERKYTSLSTGDKVLSGMIPNVALYWAIKAMCSFEGKSIGAHWWNIAEPISSVDDLSVGLACLMLVLNTVLYSLLTLYLEAVIPSEYGLRRPWYFIFQMSTWRPRRDVDMTRVNSSRIDVEPGEERPGFEEEPAGLNAGVVLKNLSKRFGSEKLAVDGVSFKMYDGQITALLGHNGAGKTTTMSMLTGLFAPSSGTATVNGYNICTEMSQIRKSMGLCPQHNMLFDKLTVHEHLVFFGRLKGLSSREAEAESTTLLTKLQLKEKRNVLSMALSGGQKRKLSLGMALIGGTKTVILDEVSSGMDPEARRAIWDLLLEMRGERTIVLTTHFMEEADVLGDRIAIMAGGQVKCCGTPMFLKKFYGAGYTLKMTTRAESDAPSILRVVQSHVPNAVFRATQAANTAEVAITLPNETQTTALFPGLFTELSARKEELGILTIGLSLTTMDEVFVKVGEQESDDLERRDSSDAASDSSRKPIGTNTTKILREDRLTGLQLAYTQFCGLLRKRMIYTLRKRRLFLSQFVMPLLLLIVAIRLSNRSFLPSPSPHSLQMSLDAYKNPVTFYAFTDQSLGSKYGGLVGTSGVRVLNGSVTDNLVEAGVQDVGLYRARYIVAADLNATSVTALFSSIPHHASPLSINLVSNAVLKSAAPEQDYGITVANHPLKSALSSLLEASQPNPSFATVVPILFGVFLTVGLALFAASFIVFPVEEKLCKAKQLQLMTGVNPVVFWGSSLVWDFLVMALLICLMVLCFPLFQTFGAFTVYGGAGVILVILLAYGFSAISFSYLCSLFVQTVPGGFSFVTILHIVTGMILSMVVYFLEDAQMGGDSVVVREIGRLFPAFGASLCIMRFTAISTRNSRCNILAPSTKELICNPQFEVKPELRQCCSNCANFTSTEGPSCFTPEPYFRWISNLDAPEDTYKIPGVGQDLFYLMLMGFVYQVLLLLVEFGLLNRIAALIFRSEKNSFQTPVEDEDVKQENERVSELVSTGRVNEDAFVVENLCKSYGSLAAVSKLSFGVHHGECFGLLGVNGAGKTTTFRMLTGDEIRSNGNAYALMRTLQRDRKQFLGSIGYCPQFDGIVGVLSGQEMLELFCRLRGVPPAAVETEAHKWLHNLGLFESRNVQCQKYSGGMKRRLSAAMALIGDPPVILLDEPTTGVDPIARRQFWTVLSAVRDSGQAVVLTSHSMEECEALCSRLGIMVNGQFQCLGGVEHLKNKFAQGYSLQLKLKPLLPLDSPQVSALCAQISLTFNPCTLKDKHQNMLQFQVLNRRMSWGEIYAATEALKDQFSDVLEEYSVSETTLEEVFLSFARKQYSARDANVSCLKKLLLCQCCN